MRDSLKLAIVTSLVRARVLMASALLRKGVTSGTNGGASAANRTLAIGGRSPTASGGRSAFAYSGPLRVPARTGTS